jgi:hypothetical protein
LTEKIEALTREIHARPQHTGRKLFDIARAILDSHQLVSPTRVETPTVGARAG